MPRFTIFATSFLALIALIAVPRTLHAQQQEADDLNERSKLALAHNDIELSVGFICDAAKLDPKKYDKKCVAAKHHANEELQAFDGIYTAGQLAMQQKNYPEAIKQLSKISFGPRHDDSVHMIQEAKSAVGHPAQVAANKIDLAAAQAAYDRGDLTAAEVSAKLVQVPELQSSAQQILTNIRIYREAIDAGDAATKAGNYPAAQQKYKFAMVIRPNGPGNPAGKLQEVGVLLAASTITKQPATAAKPLVVEAKKPDQPLPGDPAGKIRAALAEGHAAEARKENDAALQAYDRVLALNPHQADALAAKQRLMDSMKETLKKTPQSIEDTLATGLHSYYRSQLAEAGDAISLYLTAGGTRNRGVAYFYLGATFESQALLADPKAKSDYKNLEQHALLEFQQARCQHYNPIERYISPRILAIWNKTTC